MLEKVENYIRQWKMLEKGDKVVVGLSGGADSVCLFLILEELRKKIGFEILAVHVNHGIRGEEAKADEEFVKTLCEKKEIPCRSVSVDIPKMAVEYRMSEEGLQKRVMPILRSRGMTWLQRLRSRSVVIKNEEKNLCV